MLLRFAMGLMVCVRSRRVLGGRRSFLEGVRLEFPLGVCAFYVVDGPARLGFVGGEDWLHDGHAFAFHV